MQIVNTSSNSVISDNFEVADSYLSRAKGLIGKQKIDKSLIIPNVALGIHTFGMKLDIDVIITDKNKHIIKIFNNVSPGKIILYPHIKTHVIELAAGTIKNSKSELGDKLEFPLI